MSHDEDDEPPPLRRQASAPNEPDPGWQEPTRDTNGQIIKVARIPAKGLVGGVCAGVAYRAGMSPRLVRALWVFSVLAFGTGAAAYFTLWLFLPKASAAPDDFEDRTRP